MRRGRGLAIGLAASLAAACVAPRDEPSAPPVYDADIAPVLARRCASCHGATAPAGGWSATSYLDAIACVAPSGAAATLPGDARAPILRALDEPPHLGLLDEAERALLTKWVEAGAPAFAGTAHSPGIVDPRSGGWHGKLLRDRRWAPMLDPNAPDACGRCHEGAPARPSGVTASAPGATACTTCHDQPGGVLACTTCHSAESPEPSPRDACFFPAATAKSGAHAAHLGPSPSRAQGLACSTCHPTPSAASVVSGLHGNGSVEIVFDASLVAPEASFDPATGVCAVACHDRGGAHPRPAWNDAGPMGCNDCHASPPAGHYAGACTKCHREPDAAGTKLSAGPLHVNGRVDLGDGGGGCGACHGSGDDPRPSTGAHAAHASPTLTTPIECGSCHVVPATVIAPGHLDGVVEVAFSGRAKDRGAQPQWDGKSCADVACHGARLLDPPAVVPVWADASGAASECGACHGVPPTQHTASTSCGSANCHGSEIASTAMGPVVTVAGRHAHVNGLIDVQ